MRVCLWHGWLLEGSGSNVYAARVAEAWRREGHDVMLVCQERHPEMFGFVDAWATIGEEVSELRPGPSTGHAPGRVTLLRPEIGRILPVFVWDEYEGFEVKTFVDLSDEEYDEYLRRNVRALRTAIAWHESEALVTGHAVPGGPVGLGAAGPGNFVTKLHGSDIEYALRAQPRYLESARKSLEKAKAVAGASADVVTRAVELIPSIRDIAVVVNPGVDPNFKPRDPTDSLLTVAGMLEQDPDTARGRPPSVKEDVRRALGARDEKALGELAGGYDQAVPDRTAAADLRALAEGGGPLVGFIGKLIPQKGVELLLQALALSRGLSGLVVGFGTFREWLSALAEALDGGDEEAVRWLGHHSPMQIELGDGEVRNAEGFASAVTFTGRLDHRYAPYALAALDVLVVPSTMAEAFAMVTAEGAAAGALPLVSRHSGLAEAAKALEDEAGEPGIFSFEPGPGASERIREGIERLISVPGRGEIRDRISSFVARNWSWDHTASALLEIAKS